MLAAFISAAVALLTFTLTQWITGLRARHELLRAKLEELCRLVVSIRSRVFKAAGSMQLPEDIEEQKKYISDIKQGVVDDSLHIQMIATLYFPALRDHAFHVAAFAEMSVGYREWLKSDRYEYDVRIDRAAMNSLNVRANDMFAFVNLEYKQLTENPAECFKTVVTQILG